METRNATGAAHGSHPRTGNAAVEVSEEPLRN
jgi:hypothetical protein